MDDRRQGSFGLPITVAIVLLAVVAAGALLLAQGPAQPGEPAGASLPSLSTVPATVTPAPAWLPGGPTTASPALTSSPVPTPTPTPSPTPGLVALPKLSPRVPHAKMSYYSVSGTTPAELIASMGRKAPISDEKPGTETLAFAELRWGYTSRSSYASGTCRIGSASVDATYRVTLPRWTKPARVRPETLAWWKVVLEKLRSHEERHIRIYRKWVAEFRRHIVGTRCGSADAYFDRIEAKMDAEGAAFDARFGSMDWPPYPGDWSG